MKTKLYTWAVASLLCAMTAGAIPINITVSSTGALLNGTGVANMEEYGQINNDPAGNLSFLNQEIAFWNGVSDPEDFPVAIGPVALDVSNLDNIQTYNAVAGFDYVVFHFTAGQAGGAGVSLGAVSSGGWWQAFYLGGEGSTFGPPSVGDEPVGGFSSARYYNPHSVPDGGSTMMLLGTAFGVIAVARRKIGT